MINNIVNKVLKSSCKHKVGAIAFDAHGDILGISSNQPRYSWEGGSSHAEMRLMHRYGKKIRLILILRINSSRKLLPIDPCCTCSARAKKLGIRIRSLKHGTYI